MYSRRHLLLYYFKYKDSPYFSLSVFLIVVAIAFLLLMKVVLPQMYNWFSINNEVVATRKKVASIDSNIQYINSLNQEDLAQKRALVTRSLPFEKDIQGILTTISSAAISSGIKLDDFSLAIGDLAPKSTQSKVTPLAITISGKGSPKVIRNFITSLQTQLPLASITSIEINTDGSATIDLGIFFKTLPVFKVNDTDPIQRISGKFDEIYPLLTKWADNTDAVVNTSTPVVEK